MNQKFEFNDKTYFIHPTFQNYATSADGYIINRKRLEPRKGYLSENGYYIISPGPYNTCPAHRFVYEAVNQTINRLMEFPPMEDNDCEFTRTENKIINKMFYRMCHDMDDTNFPLYND